MTTKRLATGDAGTMLNRSIGPVGASLSGIGIVLGAGIYVLIGEAAGEVGNGVWAAFLLGAILATATGLSYAELTSMIPESGAAAAFSEEAFGRHAGFTTGWMDIAVNIVAVPAVAIGFGGYFADLVGGSPTLAATGAILVCAVIILSGVGQTVGLAAAFAVVEASGLVIVALVGLPWIGDVDLLQWENGVVGVLGGAALVFFAYEGFEEIATLSEEVKEPSKNIPRALLIALASTGALYVLVAVVAVSVVPAVDLAGQDAPLARVAEVAAGDRVGDVLSVVALFATFNTVLLILATGPRAMFGMAQRGLLPSIFGSVWAARQTPWFGTVLATAVAIVLSLTGDLGYVAQVTNFAVFTVFVMVNASVIRLRRLDPDRERPFRLRPDIARIPVIPVIGLLGCLVLSVFMERAAFVTGAATLVAGIVLSLVVPQRIMSRR